MRLQQLGPVAVGTAAVVVAGLIACAVLPPLQLLSGPSTPLAAAPAAPTLDPMPSYQPPGAPVQLSDAERQALGVETTPARPNDRPREVRLSGTTALDSDTLAHVHPRFGGEATEVEVRLGQQVKRGQPLARLWSKDLGEKKSELIDARSQMRLSKDVLDKLEELYRKGATSEAAYRQAQRDHEASRIAYDRAYHTLLAWRLTREEIDRIDRERDSDWPRVTVEAPIAGTVVEKNVVPGEMVDPTMNLFALADLSSIAVWAYAYPDDLLQLHAGQPWHVTVEALPNKVLEGHISVVGAVVDPAQHTATVQGVIPNPDEVLRAGMFATATVALPPDPNQVVVPTSALIDAGEQTFVYVQWPEQPNTFQRRAVHVQERRRTETVLGAGLQPGERVVSRGALEIDEKAPTD